MTNLALPTLSFTPAWHRCYMYTTGVVMTGRPVSCHGVGSLFSRAFCSPQAAVFFATLLSMVFSELYAPSHAWVAK